MTFPRSIDRCPGSGCDPDEWEIEFVRRGRVVETRDPATEFGGIPEGMVWRECPWCGRMFQTETPIRKRKRLPIHVGTEES